MEKRYLVFDRGLDTEISRISANLTARLRNETEGQDLEIFDNLEAAKAATLAIIERYSEKLKPKSGMFSTAPKDQARDRLDQVNALTEDDIEDYIFL